MNKKQVLILLVVVGVMLAPVVFAQQEGRGLVGCTNDCTIKDFVLLVFRLINFLLSMASMVAMLFIIWGGWGMVTAGGNEEKITAAKSVFSHAVIGFFLIMVAFILLDAIVLILGPYSLKELLNFIPI